MIKIIKTTTALCKDNNTGRDVVVHFQDREVQIHETVTLSEERSVTVRWIIGSVLDKREV